MRTADLHDRNRVRRGECSRNALRDVSICLIGASYLSIGNERGDISPETDCASAEK
jgi:hypothetical protein